MSYLLQASPLTRLFIPEWHQRLLVNPGLIMSSETFKVHIPRPVGAIELWHGKPILASTLTPRSKTREVTEDEVTPLVQWLVNEQNAETDIWGVVEIPVQNDIADAIMLLIQDGNDKEHQKLLADTRAKMASAIIEGRKKADERVKRACGKMYNIVKATVDEYQKNNKGIYSPSYSEALAMEVMKSTIKERRQPDQKAAEMMTRAMSELSGAPTVAPQGQSPKASATQAAL